MFLQNSGIMLSCFEESVFCYLFGSQLILQFPPSSKMGEENFSKKSVVAGQKNLFSKRERQVNFL